MFWSTKWAYWKGGGEPGRTSAPTSLWSSSISSPQGMTFWSWVSAEVGGARGTHLPTDLSVLSSSPFPSLAASPLGHPGHHVKAHPSLSVQCHSSSILLYLRPRSSLLRFHSTPAFCDKGFSLPPSTDSISFQLSQDVVKEGDGACPPPICSVSVACSGCCWHPSSTSEFPGASGFSSRCPTLEATATQAEIEQLGHVKLSLSLPSNGYKNPGAVTMGKWEDREMVFDVHFPAGRTFALLPVLFLRVSFPTNWLLISRSYFISSESRKNSPHPIWKQN